MVKHLKQAKSVLISVMLMVLCLRVILWAITPFIPLIIESVVIISALIVVIGVAVFRTTKF